MTAKGRPRRTRPPVRDDHKDDEESDPTPAEWAAEQLEKFPARSREWERRTALIYGIVLDD